MLLINFNNIILTQMLFYLGNIHDFYDLFKVGIHNFRNIYKFTNAILSDIINYIYMYSVSFNYRQMCHYSVFDYFLDFNMYLCMYYLNYI